MKVQINNIAKNEIFLFEPSAGCLLKYPAVNPAIQYESAVSPIKDPLRKSSARPDKNPEIIPGMCPLVYPRYITNRITISGVIL